MVDSIGGRKVIVSILTLAVGIGLVFAKGDVPANMLTLIMTIVGAFVAGNAVEHATEASVSKKQAECSIPHTQASPLSPEIVQQIANEIVALKNALEDLNARTNSEVGTIKQAISDIDQAVGKVISKLK